MRSVVQVRDGVVVGTASINTTVDIIHDEDSRDVVYVIESATKAPIDAVVEEVDSGIPATRVDTGQNVFIKITPKV